jgi:hypothetical protein
MPADSKSRPRLVQKVRDALFAIYGPNCNRCGCSLNGLAWEVNHIWGREGWNKPPRKVSSYQRNRRYLNEARRGLVELTCPTCNASYRPHAATQPKPLPDYVCPRFAAWEAGDPF